MDRDRHEDEYQVADREFHRLDYNAALDAFASTTLKMGKLLD